jgi:hypothetical protein
MDSSPAEIPSPAPREGGDVDEEPFEVPQFIIRLVSQKDGRRRNKRGSIP